MRFQRGIYKTHQSRFMATLQLATMQDQCWIWPKAQDSTGYGQFSVFPGYQVKAHRYSHELFNGPIRKGLLVCHSCDVRDCVNPSHLFLGTHKDNMRDMIRKGRDRHQRKITDEQVAIIRASTRTNRDLAAEYGVHFMTISQIRNGKKRSRNPRLVPPV